MSLIPRLRMWILKIKSINNLMFKRNGYFLEKVNLLYCDRTGEVINSITIVTNEKIRYTITFYLDYKLTLKELEKKAVKYLDLIKNDNKKFLRECKIVINNNEVLSIETKF